MTGRVGIRDVARIAGVSTTTVSHALNGRGKVSAATRIRVEDVARDLGYEPNRLATALRSRRSGVLGFVSDEIATTPFAGRIVLGAQDAAAARGLVLMVVNSNRSPAVEQRQIEVLRAQQVDALLYATMFHREVSAPIGYAGGPVVLVNADERSASASSIAPDEYRIGYDATMMLLEAGHRRIAHLTVDAAVPATAGRTAGHRDAMASAGLQSLVLQETGAADSAAGRRAAARALEGPSAPTALFAFNDPMAMGVYQVALRLGLQVPADLSIVSVDNLELIAGQLLPGLTTFELPHYEMGGWALEQAVRELDEPSDLPEVVALRCRPVRRASVAAAPR